MPHGERSEKVNVFFACCTIIIILAMRLHILSTCIIVSIPNSECLTDWRYSHNCFQSRIPDSQRLRFTTGEGTRRGHYGVVLALCSLEVVMYILDILGGS